VGNPRLGAARVFLMAKPCKTDANLEFELSIVHLIGLPMTHTPISARGCSSSLPPGLILANNRNILQKRRIISFIHGTRNRRRLAGIPPRFGREILVRGALDSGSLPIPAESGLCSRRSRTHLSQIPQRALGQLAAPE
jgi:hypothetical protein